MKMKKLATVLLAGAFAAGSTVPAFAGWIPEPESNWKYQNQDGSWKADEWFQDADGRWYHFNPDGTAHRGWFQDTDGKWYFFAYNGIMQSGLIKVDGNVYFMNGSLYTGTMHVQGKDFQFGEYGTTDGEPYALGYHIWAGNGNQTGCTYHGD